MKTSLPSAALAALFGVLFPARAAADSTYTYTLDSSKATITGFVAGVSPSGALTIPATVDGYTVTGIGRSAFKDRVGITSIVFTTPANITKIGATALQGCTGLTAATLPSGLTSVSPGLFSGCTALTSVSIPSGVTTVGAAAFSGCTALPSISLPSGLLSLGESAFLNCRSLTALTIPTGVTAIPPQLCHDCRSLTNLSLPGGLVSIGTSAFYQCAGFTSLTLPSTVTKVGDQAFRSCTSLAGVTLSASLATLGSQAFEGCSELASITVPTTNATFSSSGGVLYDKASTTLILAPSALSGSLSVPSMVTGISPGAFSHCHSLTSLTLPEGLPTLATDALYYATGLTTLNLPSGLTGIGSWAVAGCTGLTGVTIPGGVTTIGDSAFQHTSSLTWAVYQSSTAPAMGTSVFDQTGEGFTVYYEPSSSGFTTPTWLGYAAYPLDTPAALSSWLTEQGYSFSVSPLSDPDGDGVNLLLAYALGLDPSGGPLTGLLPQPVLSGDTLSLTFTGNREGITYTAESSTDLISWSTEGVSLSDPDASGMRTASISATTVAGATRFLRLRVGY